MQSFNSLVKSIPVRERWIIEDKIIVICNKINRSRFKRNEFDFVTEDNIRKNVTQHMNKHKIKDLFEGIKSYKREIEKRISEGEKV